MERLERHQSASTAPADDRMAELENPLGVSRGRSVETPPEGRRMSRAAVARLLPHKCIELANGAQENEPQHPDARSSSSWLAPLNVVSRTYRYRDPVKR